MSRGGAPAVFLTRHHDEEDPLAQFLGDIAFLLELGLVSAGLVLLHAGRERSARLLRAAGWLLIVGATATAVCTGYFWLRYHRVGDFDRAAGPAPVEALAAGLESLDIARPS